MRNDSEYKKQKFAGNRVHVVRFRYGERYWLGLSSVVFSERSSFGPIAKSALSRLNRMFQVMRIFKI